MRITAWAIIYTIYVDVFRLGALQKALVTTKPPPCNDKAGPKILNSYCTIPTAKASGNPLGVSPP